jgi:WD40 repeat protein
MVIQSIENILKLIFNNYSKSDMQNLFEAIFSRTISLILLNILDYKNIFSSLGKSNSLLKGRHYAIIGCVLELPDGNIISASWDSKIKIWSIKACECIKILEGHKGSIKSMVLLPNGNIASCSLAEIKIWNPSQDYLCIQTIGIEGYIHFNKLISLPDNSLVSSAYNKNYPCIIMLDYNKEYKLNSSIKNEGEAGSLVNLFKHRFASCSYKNIILWDLEKYPADYKILKGHIEWIWSLMFDKNNSLLYSGAADYTIKVWDFKADYECIKTINAHNGSVRCILLLPNGYFASGSDDNKIKLWDRHYDCVNTLDNSEDYIGSILLLKDYRIVSTSLEHRVKIFNY